ncbi:hypothetical protein [Paraburkholderia sp. IW21]|uniref:hypothetical protein n=1 Tax=Paraburkholderia sp. IW21 TaxID=3242488 RepID=UPI003521BC2D
MRPLEAAINRNVRVPLYQYEHDALVSILSNSGAGRRDRDSWPGTLSRFHHPSNTCRKGGGAPPSRTLISTTFLAVLEGRTSAASR